MYKGIRISQSIFERLQKLAVPLEDTPADVIERLLDFYDANQKQETSTWEKAGNQVEPSSVDYVKTRKAVKGPSDRAPRQRGVTIKINGQKFRADTLAELYYEVLRFVCDIGHIEKLKPHLPLPTSRKRYLIATEPVHPNGREFVAPVEYNGYYMESHKDYKNGINHLRKMLNVCELSLIYIG